MKFTNITLNGTDKSGARNGQGLRRYEHHYVLNSGWAFGTTANDTVNDDYYVVWNTWPTMSGAADINIAPINVAGTALNDIGITTLTIRSKNDYSTGILDCAIIRKSDRQAVSITFPTSALTDADSTGASSLLMLSGAYTGAGRKAQIKTILPADGPWTPELGRLLNQGQI